MRVIVVLVVSAVLVACQPTEHSTSTVTTDSASSLYKREPGPDTLLPHIQEMQLKMQEDYRDAVRVQTVFRMQDSNAASMEVLQNHIDFLGRAEGMTADLFETARQYQLTEEERLHYRTIHTEWVRESNRVLEALSQ